MTKIILYFDKQSNKMGLVFFCGPRKRKSKLFLYGWHRLDGIAIGLKKEYYIKNIYILKRYMDQRYDIARQLNCSKPDLI